MNRSALLSLIRLECEDRLRCGHTPKKDLRLVNGELAAYAAATLLAHIDSPAIPKWEQVRALWPGDEASYLKMIDRSYEDALISAAAFIVAELERLTYKEI